MFKWLKRVYSFKQTTLYSSTIVVAITMIVARLLGLLKLRFLTSYYPQEQLDLFFAAFRIPDFIFEIFVAGSIASCFIPIINDILEDNEKNRREAMVFSQSLSLIFLACWLVFLGLMFFFAKDITRLLVPGFSSAQVEKVTAMSTTILFYQVPFLLLGNIMGALLQASHQFLVPGLAPILYNFGIILGILLWHNTNGIYGAVFGVILGAILYFLLLFLGIVILGFPLKVKWQFNSQRILTFFRLFWPKFFSSITTQIDATVDLALSTLRGAGSYTSFFLARNLQILPVSLFGIAIAQSALPFFSRLYNQGKKKELTDLFIKLTLQILFIMMPFVVFFTALRIPIVRLFFGGQKFAWEATVTTAKVLSVFALSMPLHTLYYVITRVYFAIQDTRTPFIVGLVFVLFNTILSLLFINVYQLPIWYLALSFTISITLNSTILLYLLIKKLDEFRLSELIFKLLLLFFITITTLAIVATSKRLLDGLIFDTTRTINLFILTLSCVFIGSVSYLYLSWVFIPQQLRETFGLLTRLSIIKKTLMKYRKLWHLEKVIVSEDQYEEKILK